MSAKRRRSRCCQPQEPALDWHLYLDDAHTEVIDVANWIAGLPEVVRQSVEADIEDLLELAANGVISTDDPTVFENVASFPDLWELKWHFQAGKRRAELRQYHAEPDTLPGHLVAMHRHLKARGKDSAVREAQNQSMSQAQMRYMAGEKSHWGLP